MRPAQLWPVSLLAVPLCLFAGVEAPGAEDVIVLGAAVSLTGKYASHGTSTKNGYELAVRRINDKDGVRTSNYFYPPATSRKFGSGTATLTVRSIKNLLIRPEVRVDFSDLEDYGPAGDASKSQVSVALGTSYIF